jgi:hypothetical protein
MYCAHSHHSNCNVMIYFVRKIVLSAIVATFVFIDVCAYSVQPKLLVSSTRPQRTHLAMSDDPVSVLVFRI